MLSRLLPSGIKLPVRILIRKLNDLWSGDYRKFNAFHKQEEETAVSVITTEQAVRRTSHFENKLHNLGKGISMISGTVVHPGEIFSFWRHVGRPDRKNGFLPGRNIVSGKLSEDYGGGLCQLSSIIYHTALRSGLKILERHNHSVDIYREEERFTPLGADATVVYGYKDLRICNTFDFPFTITLNLSDEYLSCSISGMQQIPQHEIIFLRKTTDTGVLVEAVLENGMLINTSLYEKP